MSILKRDDAQQTTIEKIRVITPDVASFASNLYRNESEIKKGWKRQSEERKQAEERVKLAELQNQIQTSQRAYPIVSFAVNLLHTTIAKYGEVTHRDIKVGELKLPENFFTNTVTCEIRFASNVVWRETITASPPAGVNHYNWPVLTISFQDANGQDSGNLRLNFALSHKVIGVKYSSRLNSDDWDTSRSTDNYENELKDIFEQVLETQLVSTHQ